MELEEERPDGYDFLSPSSPPFSDLLILFPPAVLLQKQHIRAYTMWWKRESELKRLEGALDPRLLQKLKDDRALADGSQYRAKMIDAPSRVAILAKMRAVTRTTLPTPSASIRAGRREDAVILNMGLDLELRL